MRIASVRYSRGMHSSARALAATLLLFLFAPLSSAQTGSSTPFTQNLSIGATGEQVAALQKILNRDSDTRIAVAGPGSPGYETSNFGPLTKSAVIRFQEKYSGEVLAPVGLTRGNGRVGSYTRAKLNEILVSNIASPGTAVHDTDALGTGSAPVASTSSSSVTSSSNTVFGNPNLEHIDKFMAALDRVALSQHISSSALAEIKAQIILTLSTTTDLRAKFLETSQAKTISTTQNRSLFGRALSAFAQALKEIFTPGRALASDFSEGSDGTDGLGTAFGGALLDAIPCNGGVWNLAIEPLPPDFVAILSYESGTQLFASYNIPVTNWLLGKFMPGPGVCFIGHFYIPSEGLILPMVGSSPL